MNFLLNNHQFFGKVAKNQKDIRNGMMFKTFNSPHNAMIFMMSNGKHCFWMKNCIIPLDIVFLKNKKVIKIFSNCPPCIGIKCDSYCGNGDMVIEFEGGTCMEKNIMEGDMLEFL